MHLYIYNKHKSSKRNAHFLTIFWHWKLSHWPPLSVQENGVGKWNKVTDRCWGTGVKPHVLPWVLFSHKAEALRYRHTEVAEREKLSIPGRKTLYPRERGTKSSWAKTVYWYQAFPAEEGQKTSAQDCLQIIRQRLDATGRGQRFWASPGTQSLPETEAEPKQQRFSPFPAQVYHLVTVVYS